MTDFTGKVILVTGAASGIGLATAIKLAALGAHLALADIVDIPHEKISTISEKQVLLMLLVDVSSSEGCKRFVRDVLNDLGKIDHVFNCAGVNPTAFDLINTTDDYFHKLINTNLFGTFALSRACVSHLKPGATITNVSSILGTKGAPLMSVYSASKWGVIGFTKSLAMELGPKGIRVNAIAPGYIDTPTNSDVVEGEEAMKRSAAKVAMGRLGTPEEVANAVAWLLSDEARYVNGSVFEINGGLA